jgi:hypothetical protein
MFFANRKKYPSVVIDSLIAAAENMESKEEYDYIIQKAGL